MRIFFRIMGIIITVLSLLLLLASPVAGVIFLVIGGLLIFASIKMKKGVKYFTGMVAPENTDTVFIEYRDIEGNFSSRNISIIRAYRKRKSIYIDAFCHSANDNRTFLVERIVSMTKDGAIIEDIEKYVTDKFLMKP